MKARNLLLATVAALGTSGAMASGHIGSDITIDLTGFGAGGTTDAFNVLGATNVPATSVYLNDGTISQGTESVDLVGKTLLFSDVGSAIFGALQNGGTPLTGGESLGYNTDWRLNMNYSVGGAAAFVDCFAVLCPVVDGDLDTSINNGFATVPGSGADGEIDPWDAILPVFTTGTFEVWFDDLGNGAGDDTKLLELSLTGAEVSGANAVFTAEYDYAWYAGGDTFVENFFNDVQSGKTFYELYTMGVVPVPITMRADFNVDPSLVPLCVDAACVTLERSTDLNISAIFKVPEPMSAALMGLGMLLLGFRRRLSA